MLPLEFIAKKQKLHCGFFVCSPETEYVDSLFHTPVLQWFKDVEFCQYKQVYFDFLCNVSAVSDAEKWQSSALV